MRTAALALTTLLIGVCPTAHAHLGAPEGRAPFVVDRELVGGGTTWGIVKREGERWLRVCEEALGGPPAFYYRKPSSGAVLIARADGLWRTEEGCDLEAGPALFENAQPALLASPVQAPGTLFVATSKAEGDNGLYVSLDEGESFAATGLAGVDVSLRSVVVSEDGERVYVSGIDLGSRDAVIFMSLDGGQSFTLKQPFAQSTGVANLLGIDPATGEVAMVLIDETTPVGSTLVLADLALENSSVLGEFEGVISDFLVHSGAWLVIESRQRFLRRGKAESDFSLIDGGPTRCLLHLPGDERAWGCGQPFQNGHFLTSSDGVEWSPELPFLAVEDRRCPLGSEGEERCAYLFPNDGGVVDGEDAGTGGGARVERPGEEEPGCPCSGAGGGDVPLLALLLGLLFIRGWRRPRPRGR